MSDRTPYQLALDAERAQLQQRLDEIDAAFDALSVCARPTMLPPSSTALAPKAVPAGGPPKRLPAPPVSVAPAASTRASGASGANPARANSGKEADPASIAGRTLAALTRLGGGQPCAAIAAEAGLSITQARDALKALKPLAMVRLEGYGRGARWFLAGAPVAAAPVKALLPPVGEGPTAAALAPPDPVRVSQTAVRKCLNCGVDFQSTHVGNRLCNKCAHRLAGLEA